MTEQHKKKLIKGAARIFFVVAECMLIGIGIGSIVADNPFINRGILAGSGIFLSVVFFGLYLYFIVKHDLDV
jgi:NADH:ubiquinone oxidoreductase subunit 6 (subunit J)